MKILLTTNVFLPDFRGGTETLVHGVATALARRGHSVLVVTGYPTDEASDSKGSFDEYAIDSIRVVRYKSPRPAGGAEGASVRCVDRDFEAGFRRVTEGFAPEVVHFHHLQRLSVTAVDVCCERRIPAFLTVTDYWCICPTLTLLLGDGRVCDGPVYNAANCLQHIATMNRRGEWGTRVLACVPARVVGKAMSALRVMPMSLSGRAGMAQALALRRGTIASRLAKLDRIFVPTRFTQVVLERGGIDHSSFRVLPFALGQERYNRRIRSASGGTLVLGYIGSLLPHKGLHVLLDAMNRLPRESGVELRIYGSAPEAGAQYAHDLRGASSNDARVRFAGTFEGGRIAEVLDGIDALVIPSLWHENMPLVALSAQAAGCPILASDVGGLADVVTHEDNGLLFSPGSSSALAVLIQRLKHDDLLATLSSRAVSPPGMDDYVGELEAEYRDACMRGHRCTP